MVWRTIAEGNSEAELRTVIPDIDDIPKGTKGLIEIHAPGAGLLFDLAGAEQIADIFLAAEIKVIDVYGEGWSKGFISFEAVGAPVVLILLMLLTALATIGVLSIMSYFGLNVLEGAFPWGMLLIGGLAVGGLLIFSSLRR